MTCKDVLDCPSNPEFWANNDAFKKAVIYLLAAVANSSGGGGGGSITLKEAEYLALARAAYTALNTTTYVKVLDNSTAEELRIIVITNDTDVPIYISFDGAADHIIIPSKTVYEYAAGTNFLFHAGDVYIKLASSASSGSVYVNGIY